jgi:hypothetical protein
VWWKRGRPLEYVPLTLEDAKQIDEAFEAAGRGHVLR